MIAVGLLIAAVLIAGVLGMLWWDGVFTDAQEWLPGDPRFTVEYQPPTLSGKASKGFTRSAKVVPLRASQPPQGRTK